MAQSYTREALIERARSLVPMLKERALATSQARTVPAETIKAFWDADLGYLLKPKAVGGPEVRFDTVFELASVLSQGDGSAAWVWAVTAVHDLFAAYLPEQGQREYWEHDRTLSASSFAPSGKFTPAPGGMTLNGKWSFCSGIDHARLMLLAGIAGMLSQDPPIPDIRFAILPIGDVKVIDDWYVMGLTGSGSKTCVAENVFVPEHRMVKLSDLAQGTTPGASIHKGPLYRTSLYAVFPFCVTSCAWGLAKGAVANFIAEMKGRGSTFDHSSLARKPTIQLRLAEASALADAAELLYMRSLRETIDKVMAGETLSTEHRVRSRRDQAYSIQLAKRATEILLGGQGGNGLFERSPVQRAMRDLNAIAAHIACNWDMPALNFGQVMLGGPPTDPFF